MANFAVNVPSRVESVSIAIRSAFRLGFVGTRVCPAEIFTREGSSGESVKFLPEDKAQFPPEMSKKIREILLRSRKFLNRSVPDSCIAGK